MQGYEQVVALIETSELPPENRQRQNFSLSVDASRVQAMVTLGHYQQANALAQDALVRHPQIDDKDLMQLQPRYMIAQWRAFALQRMGQDPKALPLFAQARELASRAPG